MSRPKVVLTNPSVPVGENIIREVAELVIAPDPGFDTMRSLIGDCDVLVVRAKLPDDLFERPNRLKGVVRHGAGVDLIPMESATKLGIPVANVPGVNAQTVAEHVVTTMLMLARGTHRRFGYKPLVVMGCYYFVFAVLASGSAVSSGLFVPMLMIGAVLGRIFGLATVDVAVRLGKHWSVGEAGWAGQCVMADDWRVMTGDQVVSAKEPIRHCDGWAAAPAGGATAARSAGAAACVRGATRRLAHAVRQTPRCMRLLR